MTHTLSRYDYMAALEAHGFVKLGEGIFSQVYSIPGHPDKVLKVSKDTAWLAYVLWAQEDPSRLEWAPKLYSVKWHDGYYVAITERIPEIARERSKYDSFSALKYPEAKPFLEEARKAFPMNDMHAGNWGFRNSGHPVIFDPTTGTNDEETVLKASHTRLKSRSNLAQPATITI